MSSDDKDNRNVTSAVCRSKPNGLNTLNSEINECTSSTELKRNANFAENTFKLQKDIEQLRATVTDSLMMGDSLFGQFGSEDIRNQVKARNHDLKAKKEKLMKEIDKKEAIIERSDRDFSDVKNTLPEKEPKQVLHFIEDYTLLVLIISYLFMIISAIYIYTLLAENKLIALGQSVLGSVFLTCFMLMLLYYLT